MGIKERLDFLRKRFGLNEGEFAESIGYTRRYVRAIKKEEVALSDAFISRLHETYNIKKEWITKGTGDIFENTPAANQKVSELYSEQISELDRHIRTLLQCDNDFIHMVYWIIEDYSNSSEVEKQTIKDVLNQTRKEGG